MDFALRHIVTLVHGWIFGTVLLAGYPLALAGLAGTTSSPEAASYARDRRLLSALLWGLVLVGWITVIAGAYLIYPWYRAKPPAGITDLAFYPRSLLLSVPVTASWHTLGMEWKEHVSWLAPIALTAAAFIHSTYGAALVRQRGVRGAVLALTALSFVSAGVAGVIGLQLNKVAPVRDPVAVARGATP